MSSTIADTIDLAINKYLWDGGSDFLKPDFSCGAIVQSCDYTHSIRTHALEFICSLGCDRDSRCLFSEFPSGPKRQYARALWLTWAAMIAREEGL